MRVLVTGATGFLGSHLVDRLAERGDEVRALVRPTSDTAHLRAKAVELVTGDVARAATLPAVMEGVDVVYHAAAMVGDWGPWRDFEQATITGTRNVFRTAAAAGVPRVLHVSTDGVYAFSALRGRVTESSTLERNFGWLDYYRRSKSAAERIARRYMRSGRTGVTIVRPGFLLGERDRSIFPGVVEFLESNTAAYLGDGNNRLPYVYAGDVAEACILGATREEATGRIYNVASDEKVTQRSLFEAVAAASGLKPPARAVPFPVVYAAAFLMEAWCALNGRRSRPSLTRFSVNVLALDYREDCSRIRRELGWEPTVPLLEAIQRASEASKRRGSEHARG